MTIGFITCFTRIDIVKLKFGNVIDGVDHGRAYLPFYIITHGLKCVSDALGYIHILQHRHLFVNVRLTIMTNSRLVWSNNGKPTLIISRHKDFSCCYVFLGFPKQCDLTGDFQMPVFVPDQTLSAHQESGQ